jgi:small subunit ribosomal protein S8
VIDLLKVMQKSGFVGSFEYMDNGRGGKYKIYLLGNVNSCGSIRPRFNVTAKGYEKYEKRFLPAAGFGILIVSTSKGVMSQEEAREQGIGGKLLAFVY